MNRVVATNNHHWLVVIKLPRLDRWLHCEAWPLRQDASDCNAIGVQIL